MSEGGNDKKVTLLVSRPWRGGRRAHHLALPAPVPNVTFFFAHKRNDKNISTEIFKTKISALYFFQTST